MKLPVIITEGVDGYLIARCPVIPGCVSQGTTEAEMLANIREAIEVSLYEDPGLARRLLATPYQLVEVETSGS